VLAAPEHDWGGLRAIVARLRARLYRDGLMIALLANRPQRPANLVQLTLGRELVRHGAGWCLEIPGADTKTGASIELPWPEDLLPALEAYLTSWRLQLARVGRCDGCGALWLGSRGRGVSCQQAYSQIAAHTRAACGRAVNPRLFRDAAVTTVACDRPAHVRLATTERHYNLARTAEAATAWHGVLAAKDIGRTARGPA
jgi:hypothetical protein